MFRFLRRLSSSNTSTSPPDPASSRSNPDQDDCDSSHPDSTAVMPRQPAPYEVPDKEGRCWLLAMPEEVLANVFTRLDRCSLTRCYRVSRGVSVADLVGSRGSR